MLLSFIFFFISQIQADPHAVHGMLMFGEQKTYASHLPMFHSPHDYQLILEIQLNDSFQLEAGDNYFTLAPEPMDLTEVIDGQIKSFSASVFSGHFERGGKFLGTSAITIKDIIFSKKLDANEPKKVYDSYLVFGDEGDFYVAHIVEGRPDFDFIAQSTSPSCYVPPRTLHPNCSLLQFPLEIRNLNPQPGLGIPEEGSLLSPRGLTSWTTNIKKTIYVETGDLSF